MPGLGLCCLGEPPNNAALCFGCPFSLAGGGSLLQQMRQRLQGGRFRWLNETLYTSDGSEALRMVQGQPDLMDQYHEGGWVGGWVGPGGQPGWHFARAWYNGPGCWHLVQCACVCYDETAVGFVVASSLGTALLHFPQRRPRRPTAAGFREQTKGWPVQPVDQAIRWLQGRPPTWAVADLGCGDAKIAASVRQRVHSFDLAATAPGVIACNMASLPLPAASVDAAIFCLSLMGTDYGSFLAEAARVLRPAGWLWIAEVQSRFVSEAGRSVLPDFLESLGQLGFAAKRQDTGNTHFLVLELQRGSGGGKGGGGGQQRQPVWPELRPCQYKKR